MANQIGFRTRASQLGNDYGRPGEGDALPSSPPKGGTTGGGGITDARLGNDWEMGMPEIKPCEEVIWMLGRIWSGHVQLREQGADLPKVGSYWEPGAVWMNGDDLKALHFAAFMVGVTLHGAGRLPAMWSTFHAFEAQHGETAGAWLAARWAGIGGFTA